MLLGAIKDPNPITMMEHRWLHGITEHVPEGYMPLPFFSGPCIARPSCDTTIAATSYMVVEALATARLLANIDCEVEVIDIRVLRPLDNRPILDSVARTGALITVETGFGVEIVARVCEQNFSKMRCAPRRLGSPDYPSPSTPSLILDFHPCSEEIIAAAMKILGIADATAVTKFKEYRAARAKFPLDQPDSSFTGPF